MPGSVLRRQARQFILNLLAYFFKEKDNGGPLLPTNAVHEVIIIIFRDIWYMFDVRVL